MQRRLFLRSVAAGGALALAGCGDGNPLATTTSTTADAGGAGDVETGDGITGDGGAGTGGTGDGGTTTVDEPDSGTSGGAGTGGETGDGGGSTPTETTEWTPTDSQDVPTLGSLDVPFVNNYRYRMDFSNYNPQPVDMILEGEWHAGDYHNTVDYDQIHGDFYYVGGTIAYQTEGHCASFSDSSQVSIPDVDSEQWADTTDTEEQVSDWADIQASGQTTIDGEQLWVFEIGAGERGNQYAYTYYVSAESGYIRRIESQGLVANYWDWGNVGPISLPC
ncbi:MAG: hypothetical protein V5A43_09410 [Haloarculaceae archaeon]